MVVLVQGDLCTICTIDVLTTIDPEDGGRMGDYIITPCGHKFHAMCVIKHINSYVPNITTVGEDNNIPTEALIAANNNADNYFCPNCRSVFSHCDATLMHLTLQSIARVVPPTRYGNKKPIIQYPPALLSITGDINTTMMESDTVAGAKALVKQARDALKVARAVDGKAKLEVSQNQIHLPL